jgi:capsular polysaccharide biosynthesis protein
MAAAAPQHKDTGGDLFTRRTSLIPMDPSLTVTSHAITRGSLTARALLSTNDRQRVERIPVPQGADEVEIADYVWALWRYRALIVLGTLLCAGTAFGLAQLSDQTFQATAVVAASPRGGGELPYAVITQIRNLIQNASVAERALAKHPEATRGLTPGVFISKNLAVERNRDTNLWIVTVRLPDPGAAADTANFVAEEAVAAHIRTLEELRDRDEQMLKREPRVSVDAQLVQRIAETLASVADAERALAEFRGEEPRLSELRRNRDTAVGALSEATAELKKAAGAIPGRSDALVQLSSVALAVTERATPPTSPIAPRPLRSLLLGAALGLFICVLAALVLDSVRPSRRTAAERAGAA